MNSTLIEKLRSKSSELSPENRALYDQLHDLIETHAKVVIFEACLSELEHAVKNIPNPCDVVNVLSAFMQINLERARASEQTQIEAAAAALEL